MVVDFVKEQSGFNGYNVNIDEYVDMYVDGIIDFVKVVRMVLSNVVSIVGLFLIMEVLVINFDKDDKDK